MLHTTHTAQRAVIRPRIKNKDSTPRIQEIIVLYRIYHSFPSSSNASSIVNSRHTLNQKVSFQQPSLDFVDLTLPRRQLLKSTMTLYLHWTQACRLHFCFLISVPAFDCVDHDLLTLVLKTCFGITSSALDWIKSFLSNRTHFIRIGNKTSKLFHVKFGVPQGSILGPLLFIFYTTNIARIAALHGILIHLYADDTQLYIHLATRDIHQAKDKLVSCIREIQNWCASMRLRLNPTKTELIWFHRNKHPAHPLNNQCLQLDPNCIITPVNTVRDLGVLLDSSLNLKAHITSRHSVSCFFHLRRIRQVKKCLNERCCESWFKLSLYQG